MNVLNVGRCSRCLASKIKVSRNAEDNKLFCYKYFKYCQGIAGWCKEPPEGISKQDLEDIKHQVEIFEQSKLIKDEIIS